MTSKLDKGIPTRERILLASERLFARNGYAGTSLRSIMSEAGVDTGSIHYHFRTKQSLLKALLSMRLAEMNAQRHVLLDGCEPTAPNEIPDLEALLHAFFAPAMRFARSAKGADFNRVSALCSVDPDPEVRKIVFAAYDEVARRFTSLLRRALPALTETEFHLRLECMFGSMMYLRADNGRVSYLLGKGQDSPSVEAVLDQLVWFTAAGFRAGSTPL
jgi:AcrR family transcriptional regulator